MEPTYTYQIYPIGDQAITLDFGGAMDEAVNQRVMLLFHALQEQPIAGVLDIIPAYNSISLIYDARRVKKMAANLSAYHFIEQYLQQVVAALVQQPTGKARDVIIPACYHPSLAPDLIELAASHRLGVEELVEIHCSKTYRVYMIGFLPGFAYMGMVDQRIASPRKSTPRREVPAGSVGIAGTQTGIYPFASPGGWQLIAQTPIALFDAEKEQPAYLQPGDAIRFKAISLDEFHHIKNNPA